MQKIRLEKAKEQDIKDITELLKKSDYNYNDFYIKKIDSNKISEFIKRNIEKFTVYSLNDEIKGFSIAYSLKNPINKKEFFESNYTIIDKIKLSLFGKNSDKDKSDSFVIDYIYFDTNVERKNEIFLKYLEVEKIRNNHN